MKWLFINGSPNAKGHTAQLTKYLLGDEYEIINLVEHNVAQLGQQRNADLDEFDEIATAMSQADAILLGTPIYWSDMTGLLKTFMDRCTLVARQFDYSDKSVYLLVNGTQEPRKTAAGIEPAVTQLSEFLKMDFQETVYVDTSVVCRPDQYDEALHITKARIHNNRSQSQSA